MARLKKGDSVVIIAGRDKGKTGKILEIDRELGRARVEGVMLVKRHMKKGRSQTAPEGGIIEKFGTIDISNLMLADPKTGDPTRIGTRTLEDGKKVRYAKKSNEVVE